MTTQSILDSDEVSKLEQLLEEATRSSDDGVRRFVEPASGTLTRATSKQHHLVFGRRGSGKSSLLRKAAADLTVDRRPIAFVDLETFKGHAYPDVLLSVLIKTFSEFAEWLETAAVAPGNKASFWARLFGKAPTRPPFDKKQAKALSDDLRKAISELRNLLFSEDDAEVELKQLTKRTAHAEANEELGVEIGIATIGLSGAAGSTSEAAQEQTETYTKTKLQHLLRHILDYQLLFRRMSTLSGGDSFLFRKRSRPQAARVMVCSTLDFGNSDGGRFPRSADSQASVT